MYDKLRKKISKNQHLSRCRKRSQTVMSFKNRVASIQFRVAFKQRFISE